jgi:GNAT superfamily N-acetyltransferase
LQPARSCTGRAVEPGSSGVAARSTSTVELLPVEDAPTRDAARSLIAEYLRWIASCAAINYGLSFDVDAMVTSDLEDQSKFYPPSGRFYVIRHSNTYVGVGSLKRLAPAVAEVQRMYVQPHVRGIGAGRRLMEQLLNDARAIGYDVVRLESLKFLSAAHALYRSVGFVEITPYAENSMKEYQPAEKMGTYRSSAVFMELRL